MYQSPNKDKNAKKNNVNNPFSLGNNNLSVRFKKALSILLTREYYEGSCYGRIYNKNRQDGRSEIYIDQPILEKRLDEQFIQLDDDLVKFLVGATGVGKTTLIRNVFQVFDRDVTVTDNNLIIYVSFYSMTSYYDKEEAPVLAVQDAILGAINQAISYLDDKDYIDRMSSYNEKYYREFYNFIVSNNKHLIQTFPDKSDYAEKIQQSNGYKYILDWILENKPLDYRMCQLKYYLHLYSVRTNRMFDNVILILDDLESLNSKYTDSIVEYAYHCKKCLQANKNRRYNFKALISMRNYSFRIEQTRKKEAFREITGDDVILKDTVPELSQVIEKRANYVLNLSEVLNSVEDKTAFELAAKDLKILLLKMYGHYDKMLLSLTHNNIFKSMTLLFRILTNKTFMGKNEVDRQSTEGHFVFSSKDYNIINRSENSAIPGNDDVFYALVYGEQRLYYDKEDYYMMNIMHYKNCDGVDTELLGIYIIQYFIQRGVNASDTTYDGFESIVCSKVIDDILDLYLFPTHQEKESRFKGINDMMKHLYIGGALLQSIVEPIMEDNSEVHRSYKSNMNVYLSLRGYQLYKMLSYNALLLTVYRDDIDTELEKNDIPSTEMSMNEKMIYCLQYIQNLALKEIALFRNVKDYKNYKSFLGSELAVVSLMKGMRQTIKVYFVNDTKLKREIVELYNSIKDIFNNFLVTIYEEHKVKFVQIEEL